MSFYRFFILFILFFLVQVRAAYTPNTIVQQSASSTPWITSGTAYISNPLLNVAIVSGSTSGGLTNSELRASPVVVSGTVTALVTFPASSVVNQGTNPWLTSGTTHITNFPSLQEIFGTVSVDNFPILQEVFGTVSVDNFPSLYLVSGSVTSIQGTIPWVTSATGITQVSGTVFVQASALPSGAATSANQISILNQITTNGLNAVSASDIANSNSLLLNSSVVSNTSILGAKLDTSNAQLSNITTNTSSGNILLTGIQSSVSGTNSRLDTVNSNIVANTASTSAAIGVLDGIVISGFSTNHSDLLNILGSVSAGTVAQNTGNGILSGIQSGVSFTQLSVSGTNLRLDTANTNLEGINNSLILNTGSTSAAIGAQTSSLNTIAVSNQAQTHSDLLAINSNITSASTSNTAVVTANTNAVTSGANGIISSVNTNTSATTSGSNGIIAAIVAASVSNTAIVTSGTASIVTSINNNSSSNTAIVTSATITLRDTINSLSVSNTAITTSSTITLSNSIYDTSRISNLVKTTTTLSGGSSFTSNWVNITSCAGGLGIFAKPSHVSAINGLRLQFSDDATAGTTSGTVHGDSDPFTVTGTKELFSVAPPELSFARLSYTNSGTAQTSFLLKLDCYKLYPRASMHRASEQFTSETDVEAGKVVVTGQNPDGLYENEKYSGTVTALSTSSLLAANASFTSTIVNAVGYDSVTLTITANVSGASNGIQVEWYKDASGTQLVKTDVGTYNPTTTPEGDYIRSPAKGDYFRVRYTNGPVAQSNFHLLTRLMRGQGPGSDRSVLSQVTDGNTAQLNRSILAGKKENGSYDNVGLSNSASVKVAITDRPSEVRSRVRVEKQIFRTSLAAANTLVHTVTAGKTFYMTSFIASLINNANAIGEFRVRDNVTDKFGFVTGEKTVGTAAPSSAVSPNLPEPIPFTTSVTVNEISGDIQLSLYIIGYEE